MNLPKLIVPVLLLLAASPAASAYPEAYVGYSSVTGRACVGVLGDPFLDLASGRCSGRRPMPVDLGDLGSPITPPGLGDFVVGVTYGGIDECFSVGTSGVNACSYNIFCDRLQVFCP